ncbi:sensor histidine kinase [Glacieibacterium megasporae]|uniref:sensor histidine kinase n=1 Tax=Glacieibacterium megasporae TaxID=2835787 RepID=UPI001C1E3A78|nr:histidine kinase dimerization/phosphoacceptor domain -containing protein [Polymorphobacter megasporae]UAJ11683.1 HAMP domain-containing protein [Polymorphobacter megasporae]
MRQLHEWPLSVKVIVALTAALLPLGALATFVTLSAYRALLFHSGQVSASRWVGLALPLTMWLAALLIGWLVADRLLVKPLTRMRAAVERYTAGETTIRIGSTDYLSAEMTALAAAFDRLANDSARHDAAMLSALDEQKRLTREVHHRVKNNLQIVASLLSLQARETTSSEVGRAYSAIQARVGALALVHRWMYDGEAAHGVDLRALATDLSAALEQNIAVTEGITPRIKVDVDRIVVAQDTAVPVAFLITELIALAARLSLPKAAEAVIQARSISDGVATLSIKSAIFCDDALVDRATPAVRIITGMARQMRAPLSHDPGDCSYNIEFAVPPASNSGVA